MDATATPRGTSASVIARENPRELVCVRPSSVDSVLVTHALHTAHGHTAYLWSDTSKVEGWGRRAVLLRETLDRQAPGTGQPD